MNYRRTTMQIYIDILRVLRKSDGGMGKTHIVYKANLTHIRLKDYLDFLMAKKFIEEKNTDGKIYFTITERGLMFLKEIDKLKRISDAFEIPFFTQ